ncbi:MAG: hypothetical protein M8354_14210 [Halalkalicoccus sp.]|nr:hypothetical protein [Halalkalicoccus sp.]
MINNIGTLGEASTKVLNNKAKRALNIAFGAGISDVKVDTVFKGAMSQNQNANTFLADVNASKMLEVGREDLKEFETYFCNLLKASGDKAFSTVGMKDCKINFFMGEDKQKVVNTHASAGWKVEQCYLCPDDDMIWPDDDQWKYGPRSAPVGEEAKKQKQTSSWLSW